MITLIDKMSNDNLVDGAMQKLLGAGARVTLVSPWGVSGWADTRRIMTVTADDEEVEYFCKISSSEGAEAMFRGEFMGLEKLYELLPHACPRPIGWGEYESQPGTFFVVMEFLYLIRLNPSPAQVTDMVSKMHLATMGTSPGKQCGFFVPTCHGKVLQSNKWDPDWTTYFSALMKTIYDADVSTNGPEPDYEEAYGLIQSRVIPRLLGALSANGHEVVPVLLHGDLTAKNMGINEETEEPMIYDPGMFYGHNEFELGMWRTSFVPFDESYRKHYAQRILPSEPVSEWDDRNRLYSLFFHISHSAHWPGASAVTRRIILNDMNFLITKYSEAEYPTMALFSMPSLQSQAQEMPLKVSATVHTQSVAAEV